MYKLILIDYSMPEMDGVQAIAKISELLREANAEASDESTVLVMPYICCCSAYCHKELV